LGQDDETDSWQVRIIRFGTGSYTGHYRWGFSSSWSYFASSS